LNPKPLTLTLLPSTLEVKPSTSKPLTLHRQGGGRDERVACGAGSAEARIRARGAGVERRLGTVQKGSWFRVCAL